VRFADSVIARIAVQLPTLAFSAIQRFLALTAVSAMAATILKAYE
jgi:hypothetical protein